MLAKLFPANEHIIERVLRIALGLALLAIAFVGPKTPWGFLGVVPLLTGLIGSCPLYTLLGVSTCPMTRKSDSTPAA
ncbi:MAG: DUF2892 domain-containing protein [Myxococcales bacterium]|nr:DUF2892 domain-containing protein [Myxococcales bacterium]